MSACGGNGTRNKTIVLRGTLKLKQQTNADRIRGMTDEELAVFIAKEIASCYGCESPNMDICIGCWLDRLKQEVE